MCTGDGLPAQVCQQCVQQVNISYDFKIQCERSDANLRHYLHTLKRQELLAQVGKILSIVTFRHKTSNIAWKWFWTKFISIPFSWSLSFWLFSWLPSKMFSYRNSLCTSCLLTPRLSVPAHYLLGFTAMSVAVGNWQMPDHVTSFSACIILLKSKYFLEHSVRNL